MFMQDFMDSHIRTLKIVHDIELRLKALESERDALMHSIKMLNQTKLKIEAQLQPGERLQ